MHIQPLSLANEYNFKVNIKEYFVSEKYDGMRALWDGQNLYTRKGNLINAPKWFIKNWPNRAMDGELWIDRQLFSLTMSVVRCIVPNDDNWGKINFMVFDLPDEVTPFSDRLKEYISIVNNINQKWVMSVPQWEVSTHEELQQQLRAAVCNGAEGLMLRKKQSIYSGGRTNDLIKVKMHNDAECIVTGYEPGKGRNSSRIGALVVKTCNGIVFKIGTGLSDSCRSSPPEIGSTITYRHRGHTEYGVPRFASFLRVYEE